MYIVIVGAGLMGFRIASLLTQEGHDVVVVDQSESELEVVSHQLDAKTVLGSGATPRVLREAEIQRADLLIAATTNDETNMITCFIAKELGAKRTVARVRNPEYAGYLISEAESPNLPRRVVRPKSLGIDFFVNPEITAAKEIVTTISNLYITAVHEFAEGHLQVREFEVKDEAKVNKTLSDITCPKSCSVVAIVRSTETIVPSPDDIIQPGDHIYLAATREAMDELGAMFSEPKRPARSVVILGGERVGFHIAKILEQQRGQVKIIESNLSRCQEIAQKLERTLVVQGEGTDSDSLLEEGVASSDAFIAATNNDELNILSGLLAKNLGVSRSLVVVNKPGYIPLAEGLGINVTVSPPLLAASKIVRFASHAEVVATALLAGEQAQAIEFVARPAAPITATKLAKVKLPKGAIIGAIIHENTVTIPQEDSVIQPGDHVLVVCLSAVSLAVDELFR